MNSSAKQKTAPLGDHSQRGPGQEHALIVSKFARYRFNTTGRVSLSWLCRTHWGQRRRSSCPGNRSGKRPPPWVAPAASPGEDRCRTRRSHPDDGIDHLIGHGQASLSEKENAIGADHPGMMSRRVNPPVPGPPPSCTAAPAAERGNHHGPQHEQSQRILARNSYLARA